jgi:uncharacterized protein involved in exopolysaccharide biosynthesis
MADHKTSRVDIPDRVAIIWSRKWLILLFAIVLGGLVGAATFKQKQTYSATATVQVSLLQTKGVGQQNALAANTFAAQYAQLATSEPVLKLAGDALGSDAAGLGQHISASPINNYNIIGVTATATDPALAARQANETAKALVSFLRKARNTQIAAANSTDSDREAQLDKQISELQTQIAKDTITAAGTGDSATAAQTVLSGERSLLASLVSNRETIYTAGQRDLAASAPGLTVLNLPSSGTAAARHTAIYAVLGAVVGAILFAELFVGMAKVRYRTQHPSAWQPARRTDLDMTSV